LPALLSLPGRSGRIVDFALPRVSMEALAGPLSDAQAELLREYAEAIINASRSVNLVSRRSLGRLEEHFIDSSALMCFADPGAKELADFGSGAGFPGVVVAILRPSAGVTLVDSRRSRVVFLKDVIRRLGLTNVAVTHARLDELHGELVTEMAVARALGQVDVVLRDCLRLVAPGGRLVLFKGPKWGDEARQAASLAKQEGAEIARTETIALPGVGRSTTFVEFHVKQALSSET
jgi:16S rRNA (guanine527-N7)-methyltransferase